MSYAESIELLKSAEAVLLTTISQSGNEGDYDSMHKCLDLAQRIRDLTLEVSALEKKTIITPASDTPSYPEENHPVASASASSLPAYYVSDKKLWKVANKTGALVRFIKSLSPWTMSNESARKSSRPFRVQGLLRLPPSKLVFLECLYIKSKLPCWLLSKHGVLKTPAGESIHWRKADRALQESGSRPYRTFPFMLRVNSEVIL